MAQHSTQLLAIDTSAHCVGVHDSKRLALNSIKSSLKRRLPSLIQDHGIQTVIIIDFPNYNFFIANIIQPFNCRIITFITPNFWIWNHTRLGQQLAQYSDDIITIFNQEHAFYSQLAPSKTHYFGHPLTIDYQPPAPVPAKPIIGIFPGSRVSEITNHLPKMCRVIEQLRQPLQLRVYCDNPTLTPIIERILNKYALNDIPIVEHLLAKQKAASSNLVPRSMYNLEDLDESIKIKT